MNSKRFKKKSEKRVSFDVPVVPEKKFKTGIDLQSSESEDDNILEKFRKTFNKEHENSDSDDSSNSEISNHEILDEIEEDEGDFESDIDEFLEKSDQVDEDDNNSDPFIQHFAYELPKGILSSISSVPPKYNVVNEKWNHLGVIVVKLPIIPDNNDDDLNEKSIDEQTIYARAGEVPKLYKPLTDNFHIKKQIVDKLKTIKTLPLDEQTERTWRFKPFQNELYSILSNYQDFYYSQRNFENSEDIRFIYTLHLINHVYKARLKVAHHNAKIKEKNKTTITDAFRDTGLVRPKVLLILPFRDSAYKVVKLLETLLFPEGKGHVMNKKRFLDEYTGNEIKFPFKNPKPKDYELTMAGNTNDDFRLGISVNRSSIKLFAEFYKSDIIIASPLGLRRIIGAEGESGRDYDFLASIEILIVDQAEIILMQNWDHLTHIFDHMHLLPKDSHGTDFSRVRMWCIEGHAKFYRQTLFFSSMELAEIFALFNKRCHNYSGNIQVKTIIEIGTISQIIPQIPHRFYKISSNHIDESIDKRFDFFINTILPNCRDVNMAQTLIFVPNYFDYVKLRNYFKKETISFTQICEYTPTNKIERARDRFYHGDAHFMLYTERFHFYNRIRIKGIRHIIFYGPPYFSNFYSELCNLMRECFMNKKIGSLTNMSVTVIYSKYDVNQLSRMISTEKARKMILSERNVHMVVTGD